MAKNHTLTATGILVVTFLAQVAGHLLLKNYMPNAAVGGLGFLLVALIFSYVLFFRRDIFGFILVVYICSHFSYADNQGGLWNLMTFGVLAIFYLVADRRKEGFRQKDSVMLILVGVFLLWNVMGWVIKNPMPLVPKLQGIATFMGFILMFNLASNVVITKERFRLFLNITFFMMLYQFVVALNQRYNWASWNTPLIGGYSEGGSLITYSAANSSGTLNHFELFGEYGLLLTCLLVPLLSSSFTQREVRFGSNRIVAMIFLCLAFIMLTSNRAAAILVVLAIALYYLVFATQLFSAIDRFGRQFRLIMAVAVLVPVIGAYVGLGSLEKDFASLVPTGGHFSVEGVVSGKDINRGGLVTAGLKRLESESWLVGYGYGIPRSNLWAWFGVDPHVRDVGVSDFHSLYLSLPELFGWIGALAFLSMIVITGFRSFSVAMRYRRRKSFLIALAVGFSIFWLVFLINEYKISIFRNPNYQMLFWIWLGLSNSIIKTIRYEKSNNIPSVSSTLKGGNAGATA